MTKPQLGIVMLARALTVLSTDPALTWWWFVADSAYGRDPGLRGFCHQQAAPYVRAVPCDLPLRDVRGEASRADALLARTDPGVWQQRSAGAGSEGLRYHDWASHAVTVKGRQPAPGFVHTVLIRRAITPTVTAKHPDGINEIQYFLVHAPAGTAITAMITAAGLRWNIEDDNKAGKDQLGLDAYQVRKWDPWHRHVTISMLAHAFLAITRAKPGKRPKPSPAGHEPRTLGPLIRYNRAAIRGLLAATTLARNCLDWAATITRDHWRRTHQTRAQISHYRRRGDPLPKDLRM